MAYRARRTHRVDDDALRRALRTPSALSEHWARLQRPKTKQKETNTAKEKDETSAITSRVQRNACPKTAQPERTDDGCHSSGVVRHAGPVPNNSTVALLQTNANLCKDSRQGQCRDMLDTAVTSQGSADTGSRSSPTKIRTSPPPRP